MSSSRPVPRPSSTPAAPAGSPVDADPAATTSIGDPAVSTMTGATGEPVVPTEPLAAERAPRPDPGARSTGDLVRTLTEQVRTLVRGEVASAQQEMTEKARAAQPAAGMLGGAAVLGALAAGTSAVVVVRFLDKIFPPLTSAVVATGLLGGVAAALGKAGIEELKLVGPPVPERTIESVKADVAAVTEATPG